MSNLEIINRINLQFVNQEILFQITLREDLNIIFTIYRSSFMYYRKF